MTNNSRTAVREAYSKNADEYDRARMEDPRGLILSEHDRRLVRGLFPPAEELEHVLEVGSGTGRFTLDALDHGYKVTATDINEAMLERLREKLDRAGRGQDCDVKVADIFALDFPNECFDFVFSLHVIPRLRNLGDQKAALTEIARTIRPGGLLLFNYRNSRSLYGRRYRGHAAAPTEMEDILKNAGMRIVRKQGKWFLNRKLINHLPVFMGKGISTIDRMLVNFHPDRAWDVFVVARKESA